MRFIAIRVFQIFGAIEPARRDRGRTDHRKACRLRSRRERLVTSPDEHLILRRRNAWNR